MPYALDLVQNRGFNPPLDKGIERAVLYLQNNGVETFASCEGGRDEGHHYFEPTVRFEGNYAEMLRVASLLLGKDFPVRSFRRVQRVLDGTLEGIFNEVVFWEKTPLTEHDTVKVTVDLQCYRHVPDL